MLAAIGNLDFPLRVGQHDGAFPFPGANVSYPAVADGTF
jgi:hypothetical protein